MNLTRAEVLSWAAPVSAMAVVSVAISMSVPLFALLMEQMGATGAQIGLNHTMAAMVSTVGV